MSGPRRRRERNPGLLCAAAIIIACSDPTAPETPEPGEPASITPGLSIKAEPVALTQEARVVSAGTAVEDAAERVSMSLAHLAEAVELRRTLQGLAGELSEPDRERSLQLAAHARRLLTSLGSSRKAAEFGPELSAIELALDAAEQELQASNPVEGS